MPRNKVIPAKAEETKEEIITAIHVNIDSVVVVTRYKTDLGEIDYSIEPEKTIFMGDAFNAFVDAVDEDLIWSLIEKVESGELKSQKKEKTHDGIRFR